MTTSYNFAWGVTDGTPQINLPNAAGLYPKVAALKPSFWRIMIPWNYVALTQSPGTFVAGTPPTTTGRNWALVDQCLSDILLKVGCDVLAIIGQGRPSWGGWWFGFGATQGNATDYGNFVSECVQRYKPGGIGVRTDGVYAPLAGKGISHWEIWNEQNSALWGGNVDPTNSANGYVTYLKNAYTAIKAIQPGAASTVVFGGLQHVQWENGNYLGYGSNNLDEYTFLQRCYASGAHGYFDKMGTHLYPQVDTFDYTGIVPAAFASASASATATAFASGQLGITPSRNAQGVAVGQAHASGTLLGVQGPDATWQNDNIRQIQAIYQLMTANGDGGKKIWITEAGQCLLVNGLNPDQQLRYTQNAWNILNTLPYIEMVSLFGAMDTSANTTNDGINGYGAMDYHFTPRPLYEWLLSLNSTKVIASATAHGTGHLAIFGSAHGTTTAAGVASSMHNIAGSASASETASASTAAKMTVSNTPSGNVIDTTVFGVWGLGATQNSGVITEGTGPTVNNNYVGGVYSKTPMATPLHSCSVTIGPNFGADRGDGPAVGGDSTFTKCVFVLASNYNGGSGGRGGLYICTRSGGINTFTVQASNNGVAVAGSASINLKITQSGADWVYTAYVNGSPTLAWTDIGGATYGTPGLYAGSAGELAYSWGNYQSAGISAFGAQDN